MTEGPGGYPPGVRSSGGALQLFACLALGLLVVGCVPTGNPGAQTTPPAQVSSVTAWGKHFEVFQRLQPLEMGKASAAQVSVTRLEDFAPLSEGTVELEFRPSGSGGTDGGASAETFRSEVGDSAGVVSIDLLPSRAGLFDLLVHVSSGAHSESLRAGQVEVGVSGEPGGFRRAPAPRGATVPSEPVPFTKDQQWLTTFQTAWVMAGTLPQGLHGLGTTAAPSGREVVLSAAVDGVLQTSPWPFPGQQLRGGATVLQLVPQVGDHESLAELEAELDALRAHLRFATSKAERQQTLFDQKVVSRQASEQAAVAVEEAVAQVRALEKNLSAARRNRTGGLVEEANVKVAGSAAAGEVESLNFRAPFGSTVAAVLVTPGQIVEAGEPLVRLVGSKGLWLSLAASPREVSGLSRKTSILGLVARRSDGTSVRFSKDEVVFVSRSPVVDRERGTIDVILALPQDERLSLGEAVEADLLFQNATGSAPETDERSVQTSSVVVPSSALVDDGGEQVVYLQMRAEAFVRQPVTVLRTVGHEALVEGLVPGQRLVTQGGESIRRATLLAGSQNHGHVH